MLAYSTVSQLGYMFLGSGVGAYTGAVFHVMTHAFFKALLFLGAGSVIHAMGGRTGYAKDGRIDEMAPRNPYDVSDRLYCDCGDTALFRILFKG